MDQKFEKLLTYREAAEALTIKEQTLRHYASEDILALTRIMVGKNKVRFNSSEIRRVIAGEIPLLVKK